MPLLGVKGVRTAAYTILAARHSKDDAVNEPTEDSEPIGLQPERGLEPRRKNRPILPDTYPEEAPASVSSFNRTNSYESSLSNVSWNQSTQSYTSQGQFAHPPPSHNGYLPSRPGYSGQHHSDPYPGQYQPAGPPNNQPGFPSQYPYGGTSQQPSGQHQYPIQGFPYNQGVQGSPTQHQDYQQGYSNQGPPYQQNHQQQMFHGQVQEHQVYAQNQQASYAVSNYTALRRASTTPVPCTPCTCHHGTPKDSS